MKSTLYLIALLVIAVAIASVSYLSMNTVVDTVIRIDYAVTPGSKDSSGSSKWLITCENEVFESSDSIFFFKFNSSDIARLLKPGETYQLVVSGFRIPFLSSYRNIIEVNEL